MYRIFFSAVLARLDPECAHALARASLRVLLGTNAGRALVRWMVGPADPVLRTQALGLRFSSPVGVAAGVDKDASWFRELAALGFGFVELGTVTASAQSGHPRPRVARFIDDGALLNKMGFPNPGAAAVAARLATSGRGGQSGGGEGLVIGVNVGKSMVVPADTAAGDYRAAVRHLAGLADYLVLNVSSPNTPGLRDIQAIDRLRALVGEVREELEALGENVPLLVKIGPDLADADLEAVAELAVELRLDGIVAVNTTADRSVLTSAVDVPFAGGGVSGRPLNRRALEVLQRLRAAGSAELVLISVGGIETAEDVWERIVAGATLVQVYTAFVYAGPGWPRRVNRELARKVRTAGATSIQELVGSAAGKPLADCR